MVLKNKLGWTHPGRHATLRISHISNNYLTAIAAGPKFLRGAKIGDDYDYQRRYVDRIRASKTDVLLGLFYDDQLIGTCGLQLSYSQSLKKKLSLSLEQEITTVGLFIFHEDMRGRGIGHCLLFGGCFLFDLDVISSQIGAEIDWMNKSSIALFGKFGFSKKGGDDNNVILLAWKDELRRPTDMTEIKVSKDTYYE
jgi:RimJ/RimL family protein N-acetyltransferase